MKKVTIVDYADAATDYMYINGDAETSHRSDLYLDRDTGEVWATEEYGNAWIEYYDEAIICIDEYISEEYKSIISCLDEWCEEQRERKERAEWDDEWDDDEETDFYGYDSIADFEQNFVEHIKSVAEDLCVEWRKSK